MRLYHDYFSDAELFTDVRKLEIEGDLVGVPAVFEKRGGGIDESKIGANQSAEEESEQLEDACVQRLTCEDSGVNKLPEGLVTKKSLKKYCIAYYNNLMKKFKDEDDQEHYDDVKGHAKNAITQLVDKFDDGDDIFAKQDDDHPLDFDKPCTPLFIGKWNDDGMGLTLWTIRRCLIDEKL